VIILAAPGCPQDTLRLWIYGFGVDESWGNKLFKAILTRAHGALIPGLTLLIGAEFISLLSGQSDTQKSIWKRKNGGTF
jgi:hypothetical protein